MKERDRKRGREEDGKLVIRALKWPIPLQTIDSPRTPIIRAPQSSRRFGEFWGKICCISSPNPVGPALIYSHGGRPTLTNGCRALASPAWHEFPSPFNLEHERAEPDSLQVPDLATQLSVPQIIRTYLRTHKVYELKKQGYALPIHTVWRHHFQ